MEEKRNRGKLTIYIGRAYRLYHKGKNAEEIAAVMKRPVAQMEKWIGKFKIFDQKKLAKNG